MKYLERRRQRKLEKEQEAESTVEIDVSNDMTAGVVDEITREVEGMSKTPKRTPEAVHKGFPNQEIRHYRHLCPYCKMGWDDAREYQRAVCERTGYPHNDPRHIGSTRSIELRRKAR